MYIIRNIILVVHDEGKIIKFTYFCIEECDNILLKVQLVINGKTVIDEIYIVAEHYIHVQNLREDDVRVFLHFYI